MQNAILHGWLHLTDEATYYQHAINAATHTPAGGTVSPATSRIHLDFVNAFTSAQGLAHTFRHEAAHVFNYGRAFGSEAQADSVADSCSP